MNDTARFKLQGSSPRFQAANVQITRIAAVNATVLIKGEATEEAPMPPLKERRFKNIDRNSFDDVLHASAPGVALHPHLPGLGLLRVPDGCGDPANGYIRFTALADFDPPGLIMPDRHLA